MTTDKANKMVPIKANLFKLPYDDNDGHLIGSRCKACGDYFHPKRVICANCYSEDLEEVAFSKQGKVATYTIARISYPWTPVPPPFIAVQIELPEKIRVITLLTGIDIDTVKIGSEVELYFMKAGEDEDGNQLMAYAFKPVAS